MGTFTKAWKSLVGLGILKPLESVADTMSDTEQYLVFFQALKDLPQSREEELDAVVFDAIDEAFAAYNVSRIGEMVDLLTAKVVAAQAGNTDPSPKTPDTTLPVEGTDPAPGPDASADSGAAPAASEMAPSDAPQPAEESRAIPTGSDSAAAGPAEMPPEPAPGPVDPGPAAASPKEAVATTEQTGTESTAPHDPEPGLGGVPEGGAVLGTRPSTPALLSKTARTGVTETVTKLILSNPRMKRKQIYNLAQQKGLRVRESTVNAEYSAITRILRVLVEMGLVNESAFQSSGSV